MHDIKEVRKYYAGPIPIIILMMLRWIDKIPKKIIRIGLYSKFFMFLSYLRAMLLFTGSNSYK